ncbi:MAG: hypothetical protein K2L96_00180 [Muribaculaceae bacterium]|nr:hypothetical protein [Muribaculaceae bacterium]
MATEKKTDAPISVEERLKKLYELQTLLTQKDRILQVRGELPEEVKNLEDTIQGLHQRVSNYQEDIENYRAQRVALQTKIEQKQQLIARYKEQLENVRNNHEFDSLTKEVEYETLQITLAEKNINETNRSIENREADIRVTEDQIASQQNILAEKKEALDTIIKETRAEEEKLVAQAKELEEYIDERTLKAFKRIRRNARNGLGIVTVDRSACGGCFNRIPPQRQIEIRMHKKVIVCEYCGRILIDPALVGEAEDK